MQTKSRDYTQQANLTLCGILLLLVAVVSYLYFLNLSVVHVVMRQDAASEIKQLQTDITQLESEYIDAQHTIAKRIASLSDFTTDAEKIFVSRSAPGLVLRDE